MIARKNIRIVSKRDVEVRQEQRASQFEPVRQFEPGVLCAVDGSVAVSGRPGYVWCREFNHLNTPPFQILNRRVPPQAGWKVKIGYPEKPPFDRQVLDVWGGFGGVAGYDPVVIPTTGAHGQMHQYATETSAGVDRVFVYQPAIQMLKGMPVGAFVIEVQHLEYWANNQKASFTGGVINLSAYVPTTPGESVWVLVYLNKNTNFLAREAGVVSAGTPVRPALPENAIPSVLVLLTEGQTEISVTDIEDARYLLLASGGFDIDVLPDQASPTLADYIAIYDVAAAEHRRVLIDDLPIVVAGKIRLLYSQTVDRVVANTAIETRLLESGRGSKYLPANLLEEGTAVRLSLRGHLSTTSTPTLNVLVKIGGVEVVSSGATALNATVTDVGWHIEVLITCRIVGITGEVITAGSFRYDGGAFIPLVKTTATTIDTTIENLIEAKVQWGTADVANTITCQQVTIEELSVTNLAPVGPSELEASESAPGTVSLLWTDNSVSQTFNIERSITSAYADFAEIDSGVVGTTYDDESLVADTYWYRVRGFDGLEYSDYTNVVQVTTS